MFYGCTLLQPDVAVRVRAVSRSWAAWPAQPPQRRCAPCFCIPSPAATTSPSPTSSRTGPRHFADVDGVHLAGADALRVLGRCTPRPIAAACGIYRIRHRRPNTSQISSTESGSRRSGQARRSIRATSTETRCAGVLAQESCSRLLLCLFAGVTTTAADGCARMTGNCRVHPAVGVLSSGRRTALLLRGVRSAGATGHAWWPTPRGSSAAPAASRVTSSPCPGGSRPSAPARDVTPSGTHAG